VQRWRTETLDIVARRKPYLGTRWATVMRMRTALGVLRAHAKMRGAQRPVVEGDSGAHETAVART
jgi:hypothetical protein